MASKRGNVSKNKGYAKSKAIEARRIVIQFLYGKALEKQETSTPTKDLVKFEGVRKKKAKWVAEIKDPIKKTRIWLGTFESPEEASRVYQLRKSELERRVVAVVNGKKKERKRKRCCEESGEILKTSSVVFSNEGVGESGESLNKGYAVDEESGGFCKKMKTHEVVSDRESCVFDEGSRGNSDCWESLSVEEDDEEEESNLLVKLGPVIIDNFGRILGDFSGIDDLTLGF